MYSGEYVAPTLTVDSVVFQIDREMHLTVLLIERADEPFKGWRALPGGYNPAGETTKQAMNRILRKKAGIAIKDLGFVEQLYTFDTVARDPRGHAVSVSYMGLGRDLIPKISSTTHSPAFFPVDNLPKLAYDHLEIVHYARERLQNKLGYTNVVMTLMPKKFTLSQLQAAYEAIFDKGFDRRNFRKKILSLDLIELTNEKYLDGAHRPAWLYKFRDSTVRVTQNFD